jgi:gamma-tubulin complex component 5
MLDVLRKVLHHPLPSQQAATEVWILPDLPTRVSPAAVTARLLDMLLEAAQEYSSMGDKVTLDALMRAFTRTAEPVWSMVGRWMNNGMPVQDPSDRGDSHGDDEEFFIEDNDLMLLDPDFWTEGYTLRDGIGEQVGSKTIPVFLAHIAEPVLASGKAIGLLRALGVSLAGDGVTSSSWLSNWRPFNKLLASEGENYTEIGTGMQYSVSADTLSRLVFDELLPHCQMAGAHLAKVLVVDCDLWQHLSTIEDLFLMRRGDTMSHFADILFGKVRLSHSFYRQSASTSIDRWIAASLGAIFIFSTLLSAM